MSKKQLSGRSSFGLATEPFVKAPDAVVELRRMREHCTVLLTDSGYLWMHWVFSYAWKCYRSLRFCIR